MEVLTVRNLNFSYPGVNERALTDINFSVCEGDFTVLCGATGSGKSTLLRMLKRELTPRGNMTGDILYKGVKLSELDAVTAASKIGFVMQHPEEQIVSDKVWHELAFGLESIGTPQNVIRRRVSELAAYFGIEDWFMHSTAELSGGQKQLLNLAAVMTMQPDILILDEPTAQLDPIAASEFISTLVKLNRELSLTIILVEHRLEDVIPVSDKLFALDFGRMLAFGETRATIALLQKNPRLLLGMPSAVRLYNKLGGEGECPLTVSEGRKFICDNYHNDIKSEPVPEYKHSGECALSFDSVYFKYNKSSPDVLSGLSASVYSGEIFCILGGNGSGKSTALAVAAGLIKPYSGTVRVFGKKLSEYKNQSLYRGNIALLPQDVKTVFLCSTVGEELSDAGIDIDSVNESSGLLPYDFTRYKDTHPYDLSGGQMQLLALYKVTATKPRILLLDEPTKGLDAYYKSLVIKSLFSLRASGMTIITVTHDIEFAAELADRCALFFRGEITSVDVPRRFFNENSFYTTAVNRMTRGYYDFVSSVDDAALLCRKNGRRNNK